MLKSISSMNKVTSQFVYETLWKTSYESRFEIPSGIRIPKICKNILYEIYNDDVTVHVTN
jgi:hypothetical protein